MRGTGYLRETGGNYLLFGGQHPGISGPHLGLGSWGPGGEERHFWWKFTKRNVAGSGQTST